MWNPFAKQKQRREARWREQAEALARCVVDWQALWAGPNLPEEVCCCECHVTFAVHCKPCCYPCPHCGLPIRDGNMPEHAPKCGLHVRPSPGAA